MTRAPAQFSWINGPDKGRFMANQAPTGPDVRKRVGDTPPPAVNDGQEVYAYVKGRWVLCTVQCSAGNAARVVEPVLGIAVWRDLYDLRLPV